MLKTFRNTENIEAKITELSPGIIFLDINSAIATVLNGPFYFKSIHSE